MEQDDEAKEDDKKDEGMTLLVMCIHYLCMEEILTTRSESSLSFLPLRLCHMEGPSASSPLDQPIMKEIEQFLAKLPQVIAHLIVQPMDRTPSVAYKTIYMNVKVSAKTSTICVVVCRRSSDGILRLDLDIAVEEAARNHDRACKGKYKDLF